MFEIRPSRRGRTEGGGNVDAGAPALPRWTVADQASRRAKPQIGHAATPVRGSKARVVGQPFVPQ